MKLLVSVLFFIITAICAGLVCCDAVKPSKSQKMCEKWKEIQSNISSNVEGGSLTKEFPHMAALGFSKVDYTEEVIWACGGSLISEHFIVTSAHCARTRSGNVKLVRLGDYNLKLTTDDAKPEDFKIKSITTHPDYKPSSTYNDIALLELENSVSFSNYIKPACLQSNEQILNKDWSVTGWSALTFHGDKVDYLRKFNVKEFTREECSKFYNINNRTMRNGVIKEQVCAVDDDDAMCQGIGGSPLQVKNNFGSYNIIGICSFGKACGHNPAIPVVFTRISAYLDWIESIVWP